VIIGVPRETYPGERRVALIPAAVSTLTKAGLDVLVETDAGSAAGFTDSAYQDKGAQIGASRADVFATADIILQVRTVGANPEAGRADLELLRAGQVCIGLAEPLTSVSATQALSERTISLFAMEFIPRISRAQSMDALSSMATVAGYKAVLLAAERLPKMFPMLVTAAGTIIPARVFIVGAGVAGLQAIATARRLGAAVEAYDVRPAAKGHVLSLGAKFVELPLETQDSEETSGYAKALGEDFYRRQQELLAHVVASSDVVITTAAVPGKSAPVLISEEMVVRMAPGSVIVDLAAERGGNCALTRPDEVVTTHGVTILGPTNLPATVPQHASQLYAKNVTSFLLHVLHGLHGFHGLKEGKLDLESEDPIIQSTLVIHAGEVVHPQVREVLGLPPLRCYGRKG
jgi:NAD(P) transhydrogenase subunit alpha